MLLNTTMMKLISCTGFFRLCFCVVVFFFSFLKFRLRSRLSVQVQEKKRCTGLSKSIDKKSVSCVLGDGKFSPQLFWRAVHLQCTAANNLTYLIKTNAKQHLTRSYFWKDPKIIILHMERARSELKLQSNDKSLKWN